MIHQPPPLVRITHPNPDLWLVIWLPWEHDKDPVTVAGSTLPEAIREFRRYRKDQ